MSSRKPKEMPLKSAEEAGEIVLTVKAGCTFHPEATMNRLHMKFSDTSPEFKQGNRKVGSICGCIGGCIELNDEASGLAFTISPMVLFEEFQRIVKDHPDYQRLVAERKSRGK